MIRTSGGLGILIVVASLGVASAQSLERSTAAPLHAGRNEQRTDNFTGTHYWYFYGGPGTVSVHLRYKGDQVLGMPLRTSMTFTLADAAQTWHSTTQLVSEADGTPAEYTFKGNVRTRTEIIVSVAPGPSGIVREGGTYDVTLAGAVAYGHVVSLGRAGRR